MVIFVSFETLDTIIETIKIVQMERLSTNLRVEIENL